MHLVDFISKERLGTFEKLTDKQERAVALHNHTLQLGSSLMSMIALFELALRNSSNQKLIDAYGDDSWLLLGHSSVPLKPFDENAVRKATNQARRAAYSKLSYKQKGFLDAFAFPTGVPLGASHASRVKKRQQMFVVSHGQVISQTNFSFWKRLYSSEYEDTLWKKSLKKVFPDKSVKRSDISTALEAVYAARNRVAHHEPMYGDRLEGVVSSLEFLRESLGARRQGEETSYKKFSRVQYLRLRMDYEGFLEAWRTLT